MLRHRHLWIALFVIGVGLGGCGRPTQRLNAPPQGTAEHCSELSPVFTYMTDNAALSDMSIADIHFVPHTSELNSLGADRLSRIAQLIETYAGTVRYATNLQDQELIDQRLTHARDFLAAAGADMDRVTVAVAMAGADYVHADEAIEARDKGMSSKFDSAEAKDKGKGK